MPWNASYLIKDLFNYGLECLPKEPYSKELIFFANLLVFISNALSMSSTAYDIVRGCRLIQDLSSAHTNETSNAGKPAFG